MNGRNAKPEGKRGTLLGFPYITDKRGTQIAYSTDRTSPPSTSIVVPVM